MEIACLLSRSHNAWKGHGETRVKNTGIACTCNRNTKTSFTCSCVDTIYIELNGRSKYDLTSSCNVRSICHHSPALVQHHTRMTPSSKASRLLSFVHHPLRLLVIDVHEVFAYPQFLIPSDPPTLTLPTSPSTISLASLTEFALAAADPPHTNKMSIRTSISPPHAYSLTVLTPSSTLLL
jgi:hypothetical protein